MKNQEVTLIIHGPLTIYTFFSLYRYRDDFHIILVMPKMIDKTQNKLFLEIQSMTNDSKYNITSLIYDDVKKDTYNNAGNRFYHFFSVEKGLNLCGTEYAIKIRSDEYYSNIETVIAAIKKYPTKVIVGDVFFRQPHMYVLHPSDHLVGGNVSILMKAFKIAKFFCEPTLASNNRFIKYAEDKSKDKNKLLTPEQFLGCALLSVLASDEDSTDDHALIKKYFYIVKNSNLGITRIAFNSASKDVPKEYLDDSYVNPANDITDVNDYKI